MSGHTGAVSGTARPRCSSEHSSGVGVVSQSDLGFMPLSAAWPLRNYLELGALPSAPGCVRAHARALLGEWGQSELAEVTELLTSELVTNALATTVERRLDSPIRWRMASNRRSVLIEVWDGDPTPPPVPATGTPALDAVNGRGLFIMDALSTRWSWYTSHPLPGKVVWAEVSAS